MLWERLGHDGKEGARGSSQEATVDWDAELESGSQVPAGVPKAMEWEVDKEQRTGLAWGTQHIDRRWTQSPRKAAQQESREGAQGSRACRGSNGHERNRGSGGRGHQKDEYTACWNHVCRLAHFLASFHQQALHKWSLRNKEGRASCYQTQSQENGSSPPIPATRWGSRLLVFPWPSPGLWPFGE